MSLSPTRTVAALMTLVLTPALLRAELRVVNPAADLGAVRGGPMCVHRFECVNDGSAPVEIIDVRRDCGCLAPMIEKRLLQPGERGAIRFRVRTLGQPDGPHSWRAVVVYRDRGQTRETGVSIAAAIRNEVTVQPAVLALYVETMLRQEITLTDRRRAGMKVTAVRCSLPAVKLSTHAEAAGVTRIVLEAAAADLPKGRHDALLDIHTDDPAYTTLQVPVTLTRGSRPTVNVTPPVARVRTTAAQPVGTQVVRLRPAGSARVVIEAIESDDPGITCTWAAGPGEGATLRLRVDARRLASGPGGRTVRVLLAEPGRDTIRVPIVVVRD